jgi:hypothetical protein
LSKESETEEARLEFRQIMVDLLQQLQQMRPDDSSLFRVYIHSASAKYAFGIVQPSTQETTFHNEFQVSQSRARHSNDDWDGAITSPGSLVYCNPNIANRSFPNIGGLFIPYRLPEDATDITDVQWQQYVLHGAMMSRWISSGTECIAQLRRPPSTNQQPNSNNNNNNNNNNKKPMYPIVRTYTVLQPTETFIQMLTCLSWKDDNVVDDDPSFAALSHVTGHLRRSLQTPYFAGEYQFLAHWTVPHSTQLLLPRDLLVRAFLAKKYVFDDLYVIWFILVHGPQRKTEDFIVRIYNTLKDQNINQHMILPTKPPHVYLEEMLQGHPCDPLLQRWYVEVLYPQLRPYMQGDYATLYNNNNESSRNVYWTASTNYPATPSYCPTSPEYCPASPAYCPTSPEYCPASPAYCPTSPQNVSGSIDSTNGPPAPPPPPPPPPSASLPGLQTESMVNTNSYTNTTATTTSALYSPSSPLHESEERYTPQSPAYSPSSPAYFPSSPAQENNG